MAALQVVVLVAALTLVRVLALVTRHLLVLLVALVMSLSPAPPRQALQWSPQSSVKSHRLQLATQLSACYSSCGGSRRLSRCLVTHGASSGSERTGVCWLCVAHAL